MALIVLQDHLGQFSVLRDNTVNSFTTLQLDSMTSQSSLVRRATTVPWAHRLQFSANRENSANQDQAFPLGHLRAPAFANLASTSVSVSAIHACPVLFARTTLIPSTLSTWVQKVALNVLKAITAQQVPQR